MAKPKLTAHEVEMIIKGQRPRDDSLEFALRHSPRDTKPNVVAEGAIEMLLKAPNWFANNCEKLNITVKRAFLKQLPDTATPYVVFMRGAIDATEPDDELLERQWSVALEGIRNIEVSDPLGSRKRREKIDWLMAAPRVMAALQAVAVACKEIPTAMLVVLMADGGEDSLDALLPHFARAVTLQDSTLDRLDALKPLAAKNRAMQALLGRVETLLARRNDASPALAFAADVLGLGRRDEFFVNARLGSTQLTRGGEPRVQATFSIDSRTEEWFSVHVSRRNAGSVVVLSSFGSKGLRRDALELGSCEPRDWPRWLVQLERTLNVTFRPEGTSLRSNVRGEQRFEAVAWLLRHVMR